MKQFKQHEINRGFSKAAPQYESAAVVQREVADRLAERLAWLLIEPAVVLDLGCGTGLLSEALVGKYPDATLINIDAAFSMLCSNQATKRGHAVCADALALPLQTNSIDLIVSSLMIHWIDDQQAFWKEIKRILRPGGMIVFTASGPDTLHELQAAWASADPQYDHIHRFIDMHHIGDLLLKTGFSDPVMDKQEITLLYPSVKKLLHALKTAGVSNISENRRKGLLGKSRYKAFLAEFETFKTSENRYPATYEVIFGHAIAPPEDAEHTQGLDENNEVHFSINQLRRRLNDIS